MRKPNTIEDEINRIRLKIHEETKDLTDAQWVERTNRRAETAVARYGYKFVPSTKHKGCHMLVRDKGEALHNGMTFDELCKKAMDYQSKGNPKKTPNTIEDDIDRIRLQIYEETKDMTDAQYVEHINKSVRAGVARHGFKLVPSTKHTGCHMLVKEDGGEYGRKTRGKKRVKPC